MWIIGSNSYGQPRYAEEVATQEKAGALLLTLKADNPDWTFSIEQTEPQWHRERRLALPDAPCSA